MEAPGTCGARDIGRRRIETLYRPNIASWQPRQARLLCYKPLAPDACHADRIIQAVEKYMFRYNGLSDAGRPTEHKIKAYQAAQWATYMYTATGWSRHAWAGFENLARHFKLNRDIFADDSSHPIDMLNWIFGVRNSLASLPQCSPKVKTTMVLRCLNSKTLIAEISTYFTCSAGKSPQRFGSARRHQRYFGDAPSNPCLTAPGT